MIIQKFTIKDKQENTRNYYSMIQPPPSVSDVLKAYNYHAMILDVHCPIKYYICLEVFFMSYLYKNYKPNRDWCLSFVYRFVPPSANKIQ